MKSATIKGEQHNSDADRDEVLNTDLSKYHAFFIEHHDENFDNEASSYSALWYYTAFSAYRKIAKHTYHDNQKIKKECERLGVEYEDNIDLNPYDTFATLSRFWKGAALVLPFLFAMGPLAVVYFQVPAIQLASSITLNTILATLTYVIFVFALTLIIVELVGSFERDQQMAHEITTRSEEEGYERIFVLCGDLHRSALAYLLRQSGWDVDEVPSRTFQAKLSMPLRIFRYKVGAIVYY